MNTSSLALALGSFYLFEVYPRIRNMIHIIYIFLINIFMFFRISSRNTKELKDNRFLC